MTKVTAMGFSPPGRDSIAAHRLRFRPRRRSPLHEIGSQISHSDYHKHGAYILDNADAPGFALPELHRLSLLVLGHRGKLRKLEVDFEDRVFIQQLLCLRLAVILCHARRDPDLKGMVRRVYGLRSKQDSEAESPPRRGQHGRDECDEVECG